MGWSPESIKAVQDSVETKTIAIAGVSYATREVFDVRKPEPVLNGLAVSGLAAIPEYLTAHGIGEGANRGTDGPIDTIHQAWNIVVHVESHKRVSMVSVPFGRFQQRHTFAVAQRPDKGTFNFGTFYKPDHFVIALLTQFVQTEQTAILLSVVGNLAEEAETNVLDDGVSQEVSVRRGISLKSRALVPSPIMLQPYRTFREVQQPESPFALRIGDGPTVALFEADGATWQIEAVARIKAWLREHLPAEIPVVG